MRKALVTGGAGFIGSHLVEKLLAEHWQVRVLDNLATGNASNLRPLMHRIEFLRGSITDAGAVQQAVADREVVFHLAALPSVARGVEDPLTTHEVCATGTLQVLDGARRAGVRRLVYAASSSAYGGTPGTVRTEDDPVAPISPYAASKLTGEHYCQSALRLMDWRPCRLALGAAQLQLGRPGTTPRVSTSPHLEYDPTMTPTLTPIVEKTNMKRPYAMIAFAVMALGATLVGAQGPNQKDGQPAKGKVGLITNDPKAFQGYTMFSPGRQKNTFLIDMQGRAVRIWECDREPGIAYLLSNGHLLRSGKITEKLPFNPPPGLGGRIQEYTWEGELVWDYQLANDIQAQHHDICALPNGHVLCVAWDRRSAKEVLDAGRVETLAGEMLPDSVIELKKSGKTTAEIVWKWRAFDHLIQDYDDTKSNYGDVAAHPELININFGSGPLAALPATRDELQKLKNKGDAGGKKTPNVSDWTHVNAIAYNADLDHIILSVHEFSEFWVIDHGTTTAEARGHTGGKSGKGGDLLYRWGNPAAYRAGKIADQQLFVQHNAHWVPKGLPGAGNILVFNNGTRRPGGNYTSIDEILPPLGADGKYLFKPGTAFGPEKPLWSYTAPKKTDFYAYFISSAQRLANGNTFICAGNVGRFFEVTPQNDVVWEYINPIGPADGKGQNKDKVAAGGKGGISGTTVFRAYRLGLDHPGLAGRNLTPGRLLEDMKAAVNIKEAESEPSELTDLKAGDSREVAGVKLCWCPPGKFTMGSPPNEPERRPGEDQVKVTLTKGFWAAKYEVTQGQWKRVIGKLPGELTAELPEGDDYPVGNVNFAEAEEFCAKLTDLARKSGELTGGWEFRLPTEAQWEYACRAGTTTATAFGDKLSSKQANVKNKPYNRAEEGPSRNRAAKVGSYPPNAWGLHDMHGNVVEWCRDWYHAKLPGGEDPDLHDAKATATANGDGTFSRSRRGSAWGDNAGASRSALRQRFEPERRYDHIGFRVVAVQR